MANIGDVFLRVIAEMTGFEADVVKGAQKAGDKAAATMNQSLAQGLAANAGKLALGGLSVAAGIATKGMLELERVTADYRAETGATAEEAEKAGKAINAMAGRNIQPLEEVGRTLAKVHTDLGLTGKAAEDAAESFLKYGRATGRDATEGVKALDDIMDAWNLTADHAQGIMDKLIVSHQRYGGSISENEKALADLAPQLQALNVNIDDGIGLLNIFAASGLDASKAQFALNSAISKLPKGTTLPDFIAQLASIQDPAERARKAIEVFGARGGAGLANALRPGRAALSDFAIKEADATDATTDAADALDSTFGSRLKLLLKGASAALIDFGSSFGPALTAVASLTTAVASLGGGKLLSALGPPLQKAGLGLAKKLGLALASNAAIASIAEGLVAGVTGASASSAVEGAATKAGTALGRILGLAMAVAIPLAIAFELGQLLDAQIQSQKDDVAKLVQKAITDGTLKGIQAAQEELRQKIRGAQAAHLDSNFVAYLQGQLDNLDEALRDYKQAGADVVTNFAQGMTDNAAKVQKALDAITPTSKTTSAHAQGGFRGGQLYMDAFYRGVVSKQGIVQQALAEASQMSKDTMDKAQETAYLLGVLTSTEVARGVNDKRDNVRNAYKETVRVAIERLEKLAPDAENVSKSAMKLLIKATRSKIPEVARAAQAIVDRIHGKLDRTRAEGQRAGKRAGQGIVAGLNSQKGPVGLAAARLAGVIAKKALQKILADIAKYGTSTGLPTHAAQYGGTQQAYRSVIVGEQGRELFVPSESGRIIPHAQTEQLLAASSGGGGDTYNVQLLDRMPARSVRDIGAGLRMLGERGYLGRRRSWNGSW